MEKVLELLKKSPAELLALVKGLIGLIRGEGDEEAIKKVGKLLAVGFVSLCLGNTARALLKARKKKA